MSFHVADYVIWYLGYTHGWNKLEVTLNPLTAGAAYVRVLIFLSTLSTTF